MLGSRSVDTPIDPTIRFDQNLSDALENPGRYRRLTGKLIYLTVTRQDIAFIVVVRRYAQTPHQLH